MAVALLLALQLGTAPPVSGSENDLPTVQPSGRMTISWKQCVEGESSEIVVCGRRGTDSRYRLKQMSNEFGPRRLQAETSVGGGATAGLHAQSVEMPPGQVSNRLMITVKLPF